jgi:hypothetical protein
MSTATYAYSTTLTVISCGVCAIPFAIPDDLYTSRRQDGKRFYCPNGHDIWYAENENKRLQRELKWERDRRAAIAAERDQAEASLRATKGVVTKMRNRAIAGECSFCGAHVYQMARHVARKHPGETAEEATA